LNQFHGAVPRKNFGTRGNFNKRSVTLAALIDREDFELPNGGFSDYDLSIVLSAIAFATAEASERSWKEQTESPERFHRNISHIGPP
jgi:hypothetical protein